MAWDWISILAASVTILVTGVALLGIALRSGQRTYFQDRETGRLVDSPPEFPRGI